MPISDKTRKILWGRSGNRCALCRHVLVVDATSLDDESIVGDECHIISAQGQGPRHDPSFPVEQLDDAGNLILLCRVHHKMVDDQTETYTVQLLRELKTNHERWVSTTLSNEKRPSQVRIRRIKENIPAHLPRLSSGRDLLNLISGAFGFSFEHDEPQSEEEAEFLAGFLQEMQDWGDLSSDLGAGDRVKAAYRMTNLLLKLEQAGFWAFGGRENQRMEGGVGAPSAFPVAHLRLLRTTNPEIIGRTNP